MIETLAKATMGVLFVATVPVGADPTLWLQWGLAGLVVGYTLYRDHTREERMAEALEQHEAWVRNTLIGALNRNSAALEKLTGKVSPQERLPKGGSEQW